MIEINPSGEVLFKKEAIGHLQVSPALAMDISGVWLSEREAYSVEEHHEILGDRIESLEIELDDAAEDLKEAKDEAVEAERVARDLRDEVSVALANRDDPEVWKRLEEAVR